MSMMRRVVMMAMVVMLAEMGFGAPAYNYAAGVLTITGGDWVTPATLAGAYDADVSGSWGVITENAENGSYVIDCDVTIGDDSTPTFFRTIKENVYMNDDKKLVITNVATFQMGIEYNESGRNGSHWSISPAPSSSIHYIMNNDATAAFYMYGSSIFLRNSARLTFKTGLVRIKDGAFEGRYYEDSANLGNQRIVFYTGNALIDGLKLTNLYSTDFVLAPVLAKDIECNRCGYGIRGNECTTTLNLYSIDAPLNNAYQYACVTASTTPRTVNVVNPVSKIATAWGIGNAYANSAGVPTLNEQYTIDVKVTNAQNTPVPNAPVVLKDNTGTVVFSARTSPYELVIDETSKLAGLEVGTSVTNLRRPWYNSRIPTTQRNSYYASGLYWVWFVRHTGPEATELGYKTSVDGKVWSDFTLVRTGSATAQLGDAGWTLYYDTTGNKVYYCYGEWFRMGTPEANGTITWGPAEAANSGFSDANFIVDTAGYMWLGAEGCVGRSENADGTWGTPVYYPGPLAADNFADIGASPSRALMTPLTGDDVYLIRYGWDEDVILTGNFSADRAAFGADETIGTWACFGSPTLATIVQAAINNYSTITRVIYLGVDGNMRYIERSAGASGTWSGETIIAYSPYTEFNKSGPQLAVNRTNGYMYVFWETLDTIWMQRRQAGGLWETAPIKLKTDNLDNHGPHLMAPRDVDANGNVMLTYVDDQYRLKCLIVPVSAASFSFPEKGAIATQTITRRSFVGKAPFDAADATTINETPYYPFTLKIAGQKELLIDVNGPVSYSKKDYALGNISSR